jgi:hypothetical protein
MTQPSAAPPSPSRVRIRNRVRLPPARVLIRVERAYDFDEKRGVWVRRFDGEEEVRNIILNAGRVQMHLQCYGASGLATNGFNYIGLSNDSTAPAATDSALASEIAANGLARAQGAVTLPTGAANQTTVAHTFTCATAPQSAQKAALFNASSGGSMQHEIAFSQRSLLVNDTLAVTFTLTLG